MNGARALEEGVKVVGDGVKVLEEGVRAGFSSFLEGVECFFSFQQPATRVRPA